MHTRWLVVAAAAGACVQVPPFRGESQPTPLLTVDKVTGQVASTTSAPILYVVKFAASGVRTPESILVAGKEILRGGTCPFEGGVGITVYPALTASAPALGGVDATGSLTVDWAGPVIGRVTVAWRSATYTCNARSQQAGGTSTFTMFPNGRIVRHDVATPSTTAITNDSNDCGCYNDNLYNFSSFWNFQRASQTVLPDGSAWIDGTSELACAVYPDHTIGIGFSDAGHARVFPDNSTAFVYDWAHEATTLAPDERETTTAIVLSTASQASQCGEVTADLADPPISIGGIGGITSDASGVYPGPAGLTGSYEITAPVALPRGFAVSLALGAIPGVARTPAVAGDWYAAQIEGDRVLLWFRDGLAATDKITITPR